MALNDAKTLPTGRAGRPLDSHALEKPSVPWVWKPDRKPSQKPGPSQGKNDGLGRLEAFHPDVAAKALARTPLT